MAIIVTPRWEEETVSTDEKGVKHFSRAWTVDAEGSYLSGADAVDAVVLYDPTAVIFGPHPDYPAAYCRGHDGRRLGPAVWVIEAKYSNAPFEGQGDGQGGQGGGSSPPTPGSQTPADQSATVPAHLRLPTVSGAGREVSVPLTEEAVAYNENGDRRPIVNVVGDPFDPPIEVLRTHHRITYRFYRQAAFWNWAARSALIDTVNEDEWVVGDRTYAPFELRCAEYSFEGVWETGTAGVEFYWQFTVVLEHNPDGWKVRPLNTGRRYLASGSLGDPANPPGLRNVLDDAGMPVADPVPLTAGGQVVDPSADPPEWHWLNFDGYVPASWASLLA
jgi:hypothetical protein